MPSKARKKPRRSRRAGPPPAPRRHSAKALTGNRFATLLATVRPEVDARLAGFLEAKQDAAARQAPQVQAVLRELVLLCQRGGKRTRPALAITGLLVTRSTRDWEAALDVGVALELLHAYLLIHDDWMDRDQMRRGAPTAHAALSRRFRSEHLGAAGAVLAGDYAAGLALEALCKVDAQPAVLVKLVERFTDMHQAAVLGQELDVLATRAEVETTYRLKTASYSVLGPLLMGAELAAGSSDLCGALERFAIPTGVAFQLRDDLLNVFGDPAITGKPVGSDIQEGKRTLLAQVAQKRLSPADRKIWNAAYGNRKASKKQLAAATALLEKCGARAACEQRMAELVQRAREASDSPLFEKKARDLLHDAIEYLIRREY
jgi:geranylgeranyl diphosphate synthase type I